MLLAAADPLPIGVMAMSLLGGLAIFLFGMEQMTGTLKKIAGERTKALLGMLTTNRFKGVFAGAIVTSVIQSSSVTTVLVVGFVSAGLMTLSQSISVIMGAEIGTTITAQMLAFRITKFALALVAIGFALQFISKREQLRRYGTLIFGFGLLFFGITVMSEAMAPLKTQQSFQDAMARLDNPLFGILLSALFTALIQSSSATTAIILSLASQGLITIEQAIPLVFGANIGTCVTAVLASIGKPREAVRVALAHVTFNVLGVLLWFSFIDPLAAIVQWLAADNTPRQIAHAHTLFNVTNTCLFIWFTAPLAWLVRFVIPDRPEVEPEAARPKYLDDLLIQTPSLAIEMVRMELGRLGLAALHMARGALTTAIRGSEEALDDLEGMDDDVDALHAAIVTYLSRLSREHLSDRQSEQLHDYLSVANYFENIGDMIETNLVDAGRQRLKDNLDISEATEKVLDAFHHKVCWSVERAVRALVDTDLAIAREVMDAKTEINGLAADAE
ncbi:MAG: Na/Pi cotransporter family protein, partial [Pirellulales bacterium]